MSVIWNRVTLLFCVWVLGNLFGSLLWDPRILPRTLGKRAPEVLRRVAGDARGRLALRLVGAMGLAGVVYVLYLLNRPGFPGGSNR